MGQKRQKKIFRQGGVSFLLAGKRFLCRICGLIQALVFCLSHIKRVYRVNIGITTRLIFTFWDNPSVVVNI